MEKNAKGFPTLHVVGFLLSLLLTFGAAGVALKLDLSARAVMYTIGAMAVVQAVLQLFMFMHVKEGEDDKTQVINIVYGVFVALVIVAGTIWVMSFGIHTH